MPATHPTQDFDSNQSLTLDLRTQELWRNALLSYQDSRLGLSSDGRHMLLSHYFERYSPTSNQWMEYSYKIPVGELVHWIMSHGELHVDRSTSTPRPANDGFGG
ncbi:hypothetical protein LOY37_10515 [Pseudomonas sp. B21-012]|uniref:hypothetical protein n=1 Tax=unclassified Pseudomonas TaxID=196821 RepID=UPI000890A7DD|nr:MULTISPECIES: hypothetical protein [unclassified Pseudomonas]QVM94803.1 hypothetical protein JYG36_16930 [Pseudomonas sp. SORT22]UVL58335.1 hypothetical protein LOY22_10365 [Pseudomonas sp. B21-035]UVM57980.1 hypothetical protein LOY37_10515 [Pseudomonas sp. B21-012]SDQ79916.1 hypothetical protein SAMN05216487_3956 [Pseudomonas sp. UC 17F4]